MPFEDAIREAAVDDADDSEPAERLSGSGDTGGKLPTSCGIVKQLSAGRMSDEDPAPDDDERDDEEVGNSDDEFAAARSAIVIDDEDAGGDVGDAADIGG